MHKRLVFHLVADMKALRLARDLGNSPNVLTPCAFCKGRCGYGAGNIHLGKCMTPEELASEEYGLRRDAELVFGVPAERIHICCMHAEMRLVEAVARLDVEYMWTYGGAQHEADGDGERKAASMSEAELRKRNLWESERRLRAYEAVLESVGVRRRIRPDPDKKGAAARAGRGERRAVPQTLTDARARRRCAATAVLQRLAGARGCERVAAPE